jgi:hypothetical protein
MIIPEASQPTPVHAPAAQGSVPVVHPVAVVRPEVVQLERLTADLMDKRPAV